MRLTAVQKFKDTLLGFAATILFTLTSSNCFASSVKFMVAEYGSCVPAMSVNEARGVLSENGIRFPGAKDAEVTALGRTVNQINQINGSQFAPIQNLTVRFENSAVNNAGKLVGYSFQRNQTEIQMCRSHGRHEHVGNVGYLAHEIGHVVGNRGGFYSKYRAAVPVPCHPTSYAQTNYSSRSARNEEFAEVFAAFVTNPAILKSAGGSCATALAFLERQFPRGTQTCQGGILSSERLPVASYTAPEELHSEEDADQEAVEAVKRTGSRTFSPMAGAMGQGFAVLYTAWANNQAQKKQTNVFPYVAPPVPPVPWVAPAAGAPVVSPGTR